MKAFKPFVKLALPSFPSGDLYPPTDKQVTWMLKKFKSNKAAVKLLKKYQTAMKDKKMQKLRDDYNKIIKEKNVFLVKMWKAKTL